MRLYKSRWGLRNSAECHFDAREQIMDHLTNHCTKHLPQADQKKYDRGTNKQYLD